MSLILTHLEADSFLDTVIAAIKGSTASDNLTSCDVGGIYGKRVAFEL